jgi:hypothetical protein
MRTSSASEGQEQLAAKEATIDRYLTDYEDNKIDRTPSPAASACTQRTPGWASPRNVDTSP